LIGSIVLFLERKKKGGVSFTQFADWETGMKLPKPIFLYPCA